MAALINNNNYNNILPYDTKKRWLIIFTNEKNNLKKRYFRFTRMQKRYFIIDPTNVEIIYFVNHHSSLPSDRIPLNNIKDIRMIKKAQEKNLLEIEIVNYHKANKAFIEIPSNINVENVKNAFLQILDTHNSDINVDLNVLNIGKVENNVETTTTLSSKVPANQSITKLFFERQIGRGTYSHVYLAKSNNIYIDKKANNSRRIRLFAVKVHSIPFIIDNNHHNKVINELNILKKLSLVKHYNPFIVKCYKSYRTNCTLNFVLDYLPGQDLHRHVTTNECLNEEAVCYYATQVISALNFLHSNDILYRDLKPENIVLNENGQIKLIDFNIAKNNFTKGSYTYTLIGNIEYWCPEQVSQNVGYGFGVDFWQYGVLLYELFYGYTPFNAETNLQMYSNILHGNYTFATCNFNDNKISRPLKSFISALLQININARLGSGVVNLSRNDGKSNGLHINTSKNSGIYYIMKHNFFKYHNIDWKNLTTCIAPIVPTVDELWTSIDTQNRKRSNSVLRYEKMLRKGKLNDVYEDVVDIAFKNFNWEL